uniref:Uncharacterized protein n=1 Tax=Pipistrellus kuhlii TaxID=59472 RepID=A0A7J7WLL3_PIPKU|nr:hypothetical protein mPipKuh1_007984 [Pipistrellus kuhlii]
MHGGGGGGGARNLSSVRGQRMIPNLMHHFSSVGKRPVQTIAATWCLLFYRGLGRDLEWHPHVNVSIPRCFGRRRLCVRGLSPSSVAAFPFPWDRDHSLVSGRRWPCLGVQGAAGRFLTASL